MGHTLQGIGQRRGHMSLALAVLVLAVVAGVLAAKAYATTNTYCNGCKLGQVPAIGAAHRYNFNLLNSDPNYADPQIYYYNTNNGVMSCNAYGTHIRGISVDCLPPGTSSATARCHFLNGTGPFITLCEADY